MSIENIMAKTLHSSGVLCLSSGRQRTLPKYLHTPRIINGKICATLHDIEHPHIARVKFI